MGTTTPNEKKYVEANIVFDKLTEWAKNIRFELNWAELCKLNNCIIDAPVADVAEVRHGEWVPVDDGEMPECSECGETYYTDPGTFAMFCDCYKYCPNCGAKMDGE